MAIDKSARNQLESQVTIILGTASKTGEPNLAPIALYWLRDENAIIIGDMYLRTAKDNILENPRAQVCFWDEANHKTFKFSGSVTYHTDGPEFDTAAEQFGLSGDTSDLKGVMVISLDQD
ncbi:MAG: pyridoxamine 5'-phosphate oxidase family protein [Planctomycetota bacterium]|nr:MAG: pyridoxamine 5'-phosphate oxidase family protein [Planctomycetota bacterium]